MNGYELAIVFTGHRIDAPGRSEPRFPARAEAAVKGAIRAAVLELRRQSTVGIAGGASGGDLLFHEVCAELGIATLLRLALPVDEYLRASVSEAGESWVRRFEALVERGGPNNIRVLAATATTLIESQDVEPGVWERANLWMLEEARSLAQERTLLALWDGKGGDGPGGTEHLVRSAPAYGVQVAPLIEPQRLFS